MAYRLVVETRSGPLEGPSYRYFTDALAEAVDCLRNGIMFVQVIYDGSGNVVHRIEPEGKRVKLRPAVAGFESGSVVTPGLSLMGETFDQKSTVFDLADGV